MHFYRQPFFYKCYLTLLLSFSTMFAYAQGNGPNLNLLSRALNGEKITVIEETPIKDIFLVDVQNTPLYLTKDGRYGFYDGSLIDFQAGKNLTEAFVQKNRTSNIQNIKDTDMISFKAPQEKHRVFVFTDIDCQYCRKMHSEIQTYLDAGITINYLAFPRTGMNTDSSYKAIQAWCSKNKNQAFTEAMQGKKSDTELCGNSPVAQQLQLGISLGISGTPSIITESGMIIPGYVTADKLLLALEDSKAKK